MSAPNNKRVMLVDDDQLVRRSISRHLRLWGYEVVPLSTEDEAIVALEKVGLRPDVVVTDFDLGGSGDSPGNGLNVVAACKRVHVPAVLMSGDFGSAKPSHSPLYTKTEDLSVLKGLIEQLTM